MWRMETMKKINILGIEYVIKKKKYNEEPAFERRHIDGYCDGQLKTIVHGDMKTFPSFENESEEYCKSCEKHTLRHEIIHAFFNESGLMESSAQFQGGWSQNEEMVDWIAIQFPKILKVFEEVGCV